MAGPSTGAGDPGFVDTLSVKAAKTNSTRSHSRSGDGSGCLTPLDLHEHLIPAGVDILQKSFQVMYFKNQSGPIFSWVRRFLIHNCIKLSLKQNMHKHI